MEKIEINKMISIFSIQDRDLFTTLIHIPVSVFESLVADGAGHGALDAVHRLEVAPVHASDHLQKHIYRVVQKKGTVLLSTSLAGVAAGCVWLQPGRNLLST